jgi:hypothetical protein
VVLLFLFPTMAAVAGMLEGSVTLLVYPMLPLLILLGLAIGVTAVAYLGVECMRRGSSHRVRCTALAPWAALLSAFLLVEVVPSVVLWQDKEWHSAPIALLMPLIFIAAGAALAGCIVANTAWQRARTRAFTSMGSKLRRLARASAVVTAGTLPPGFAAAAVLRQAQRDVETAEAPPPSDTL